MQATAYDMPITIELRDGSVTKQTLCWDEPFDFLVDMLMKKRAWYAKGRLRKVKSPNGYCYGCAADVAARVEEYAIFKSMPSRVENLHALYVRGFQEDVNKITNRIYVAEQISADYYSEITIPVVERKTRELIPIDEFRTVAKQRLIEGNIMRSFLWEIHKMQDRRNKVETEPVLSYYSVIVPLDGVAHSIRLDHLLTLLKLEGNTDPNGEKILGVSACVSGRSEGIVWRIVYAQDEDGYVQENNRGSVDHIIPKAKGGLDRLVNMQMMRCGANWNKADLDREQVLDTQSTERVLELLMNGIAKMPVADKRDVKVKREMEGVWAREYMSLQDIKRQL